MLIPLPNPADCPVQADNPGLWFYHCHIQWHQQEGMGLVFAVAPDQISPPPADLPVCAETCNYNFAGFTPFLGSPTLRLFRL